MANLRSGSITDDKHPILKGLTTPIDSTEDGIIQWRSPKENRSPSLPLPLSMRSLKPDYVQILSCRVPLKILNSFLAVFTVVFNVAMNVTLPIYAEAVEKSGGDPFMAIFISCLLIPLIFWIVLLANKLFSDRSQKLLPIGVFKMSLLVGFLTALNGLLVVFASLPERTPPYLQGILATTLVPFTVFFRFVVLRKGVSFQRLVCTGVVLIGLFITIEPQIWTLEGSEDSAGNGGGSGLGRILWPFCFAMGFVPAALLNVYIEKETKHEEAESLVFICWIQVFQAAFVLLSFWTDFIPGFGQYAEGAIYAVIVQALVTPSVTLFWTVFKASPSFHWGPAFTTTTAFTLVGLVIITPAVVMYNHFSKKEAEEKKARMQ